ncbi:MAG: hypothetical protein AAF530_20130 [Pseudomonadota bacterium]
MYEQGDVGCRADALSLRAWRALGDRRLVQCWLSRTNPLAEGASPLIACGVPEIHYRLERQLDWFEGAGQNCHPKKESF